MHSAVLLIEFGSIILGLGLLGRFAARFRLSPIPLYLLAGLAFGAVALEVARHGPVPALDRALLGDFHPAVQGGVPALMVVASFVGRPAFVLVLGLFLALLAAGWQRPGDALLVALAVGGAEILNDLLKLLFARHRPPLADLASSSFPSGHATGSIVLYGLLVYFALRAGGPLWRRILAAVAGLLVVLLVGLSRVYLGEHYPTDVLGGWAIGLLWLAGVVTAVETWQRRRRVLLLQDAGPG